MDFFRYLGASGIMGLQLDGVPKGASEHTAEKSNAVYTLLNFDGQQEFEFAEKGLLAAPDIWRYSTKPGSWYGAKRL